MQGMSGNEGSTDALIHPENGGTRTVFAQTWATVLRCGEDDHDEHTIGLADGSESHKDHAGHIVNDSAMPLDYSQMS